MFLDQVYQVASGKSETMQLDESIIKVNEAIRKECRFIRAIHAVMVGFTTIIGSKVSSSIGQQSFIKDLLFVTVFLMVLTFIYNYLSYWLIKRKFYI